MIENFQSIVRHLSQEQFEESKENFSALTKADSIYQAYTENTDLPVECTPCKRAFRNFQSYYRHHRAAHTEDKFEKENISYRILTVEEYDELENQSKRRESIYQGYTENPDEPHECLICKKPFSTFKSFKLHFGKMHKNNEIQEAFRNV